jgi:mycothiol synthase
MRLFVARINGEAVGSAVGKRSSQVGTLYAMARVVPEARRRGAGSALYAAVSAHPAALGLDELWGRVREPEALEFVHNRGFREFGREIESVLTVTSAPEVAPPPGIEITNLGDRPELAGACHAIDAEAVPDIPAGAELVQVVAYAALLARTAEPGTAEHQLTAVKRAWRRRGIAAALKRGQIAWAAEHGFARLATYNDEANMPMRGVNARLGYEPQPPRLLVLGPLASPAG